MKLFSEGGEVRLSDVKGRLSKEPRHLGGGGGSQLPALERRFSASRHTKRRH